jgi:F-type H+-transporting ATPase subunit gamma
MAGTKEIKRRIKSIKNTKKITKAMELVAASKMRRAVAQTLASRTYASYSWDLLTSVSERLDEITHPLFNEQTAGKILVVLVTSNGSLCGGYNTQAIKQALRKIKSLEESDIDVVAIGKKGDAAMRRVGMNVVATFTELPAILTLRDITPVSTFLINEYKNSTYREIYMVYTDFISALTQKPNVRKLLPISKQDIKDLIKVEKNNIEMATGVNREIPYLIEGDLNKLIESLAEKLTRMQVYQMTLESAASEQSARMMAMKNASEASGEMIDELTLQFNKARQANITREISEISAGMASVE